MKILVLFVIVLVLLISSCVNVFASPATSYTWTRNERREFTRTQDAYLPRLTLTGLELDQPADLFVDADNKLYIADSGNARVLKYSIETNEILRVFEAPELMNPTGIYVTQDGMLYVADPQSEKVIVFNQNNEVAQVFTRPQEVAFGDTPFKPRSIAVDSKKNMFLVGEGVLNGIIHLSNGGVFLGYFASNQVNMTLTQQLQDMFFTEEQLAHLYSRLPITMTNVFVDNENVVYSTTVGTLATEPLAKHNTAGHNIFSGRIFAPTNLIDLYVSRRGIIYAASLDGTIWVYSDTGELLHLFGGTNRENDIAGLFSNLSSIAVDLEGNVWAADSETSYIQSFKPTSYAELIYDAIDAFEAGRYEQAETLWLEVLSKNQMLTLAHDSLGRIFLFTERYEQAMYHLRIARSSTYYSQAFWEMRNIWLQSNLTIIIISVFVAAMMYEVLKRIDRKYFIFDGLRKSKKRLRSVKLIDDLLLIFDVIRHPLNTFEDLKLSLRGSYLGATILLFVIFITYIWSEAGKDFLFQEVMIEDIDFNALILGFFAVSSLFVGTNYLVASIQDGDGGIGDIYKAAVYSGGPLLLSWILRISLSFVLTYNEIFIMDLIAFVGVAYSGILLILGLQEIHNYTTRETLKSIVKSLGFIVIIVVIGLIILLMGVQVIDFFGGIAREVIRNVIS